MAARTSMAKPIATARAMEPILGIGFPFNFCQTCASLSMANTTSRIPLPVATPAGALALARTVLARHFVEQSPRFIESVFARVVQLAIQCTGLRVDTSKLEFREKRELLLGCALDAGDMLGQLASESYPDRLPALYEEFQEGGVSGYTSAEDLMRKTRIFFEGHIRHMLDVQWGGVDVALE